MKERYNKNFFGCLRDNLNRYKVGQVVSVLRRPELKSCRVEKTHVGKVGKISSKRGDFYVIKVKGTSVGYKTLILSPAQIKVLTYG